MSKFREIPPVGHENLFGTPTNESCPKCSNRLYYGQIHCPDGKPGCLVLHQGYKCLKCKGAFQI